MSSPRFSLDQQIRGGHAALVLVDVQRCFTEAGDAAASEGILNRLRVLLSAARQRSLTVVFTRVVQTNETDSDVWRALYERHPQYRDVCREGSPRADWHPDFRPLADEVAIVKHGYSAFVGTDLEMELRSRGITTLLLTGFTTDVCVASTARDAFERGFHPVLVADCTATTSEVLHQAHVETHDNFGPVTTAAEVVAALDARMDTEPIDIEAARQAAIGTPMAARVGDKDVVVVMENSQRGVTFQRWCPHQGGDLAEGTVLDGAIKCPVHGFMFDLVTGEGLNCQFSVPVSKLNVVDDAAVVEVAQ